MGFIDDIGKSFSDAGQQIAQKASGMAGSAKFSSAISEENKKILGLYQEIGRIYYESHNNDENPEADLAGLLAAVKESKARVAEFEVKAKELKGIRICPSCGADVSVQSKFCTKCGEKMPEIEMPVSANQNMFCTGCGTKVPAGSKFCTTCGKAMD